MLHFLWNIGLAVLWMSLQGQFNSGHFLVGFVIGYLILLAARPVLPESSYTRKVWQVSSLVLYVIGNILEANVQVAKRVLSPRLDLKPAVVAVPLRARTDLEVTLLANLITLIPGSVSVDISPDRSTLYVHVMSLDDPEEFKRSTRQDLERRVLEMLR
ncbi:MAG TPA: Na+/H+ antiporter subunit E [Anaerolineae bacterium]|nr:Na+/H+ antiporter subunit E [Anaerolineae bacterium]HOQ98547.1 Na+/H+ antiporter subunit E [Anaerolineae bacterium]HPL27045.1 Na+/H+ antiporter subunit E [Anaerolineae bacterium]